MTPALAVINEAGVGTCPLPLRNTHKHKHMPIAHTIHTGASVTPALAVMNKAGLTPLEAVICELWRQHVSLVQVDTLPQMQVGFENSNFEIMYRMRVPMDDKRALPVRTRQHYKVVSIQMTF